MTVVSESESTAPGGGGGGRLSDARITPEDLERLARLARDRGPFGPVEGITLRYAAAEVGRLRAEVARLREPPSDAACDRLIVVQQVLSSITTSQDEKRQSVRDWLRKLADGPAPAGGGE